MSVGLAVIYSLLHVTWQRVARLARRTPAAAGMGGMA